jgi:hypothetical protein
MNNGGIEGKWKVIAGKADSRTWNTWSLAH